MLVLVRLFEHESTIRLRIVGTIAAGAPLEAVEESRAVVELHGPERVARRIQRCLRCAPTSARSWRASLPMPSRLRAPSRRCWPASSSRAG